MSPSGMHQSRRQLPALTGMRFFLALWVVIYHQIPPIEDLPLWPVLRHSVASLLHTGYAAVGIFFVLSGFVLAYNYELRDLTSHRNLKRFAIARFSRIYPAYLIALLLFIPIIAFRVHTGLEELGPDLFTFILHITLLQAWLPGAALTWNFPGWSLSNEAFFYGCFPLLGWFLWRMNKLKTIVAFALAMWAFSLIVPVITVVIPVHGFGDVAATKMVLPPEVEWWANLVRFNPLLRLPEFCLGILLALLFRRIPDRHWLWNRGAWFYLPAGAAALLVLMSADHIPYPLVHNSLLLPFYSCIIFGFALEGGILVRWLSKSTLVFLGSASYSMYILHAPLLNWLMIIWHQLRGWESVGWLWFATYLTVVVFGSCIFFWMVEDPLHRMLRKQLSGTILRVIVQT